MNIVIFDTASGKFSNQIKEYWEYRGHNVESHYGYAKSLADGKDVAFFEWTDNNLIVASKDRPDVKKVITRCIDIDAYAGHAGAVEWSAVDDVIFIAKHIQEMVNYKYPAIREVSQHHIYPGVNLSKWSYAERKHGFDIAWVGSLWITKNLAKALEVIYELKKIDNGYHLHIRGDRPHPYWWEMHCEYLLEEFDIKENVTFYDHVEDLNDWYKDKNYNLLTSSKEAFSYVTAESASKGIKPLVMAFKGCRDVWPVDFVYRSISEVVKEIVEGSYNSRGYRKFIQDTYSEQKMFEELDKLLPDINVA